MNRVADLIWFYRDPDPTVERKKTDLGGEERIPSYFENQIQVQSYFENWIRIRNPDYEYGERAFNRRIRALKWIKTILTLIL